MGHTCSCLEDSGSLEKLVAVPNDDSKDIHPPHLPPPVSCPPLAPPVGSHPPTCTAEANATETPSATAGGRSEGAAAPTTCLPLSSSSVGDDDAESIREWLDGEVKVGFGAKFATAFEEVGLEDKSDLHELTAAALDELIRELVAAGAKTIHLARIHKAIEAIAAPATAVRDRLDAARATDDSMAETAESPAIIAAKAKRSGSSKPFAAFLSHHKLGCAMEARFLKSELERMLGGEIFLDSDDLKDLRRLGQHVIDSDVLVLLQSSEVLLRPWCIFEIVTAIDAGIPIVSIVVASKGYDFVEMGNLMLHLDTLLEERNPGAPKLLTETGIDLKAAAWKLSSTIPNVISIGFNSSGSQNSIMASLMDLIDGLRSAYPVPLDKTFDDWLTAREDQLVSSEQHGMASPQKHPDRSTADGVSLPTADSASLPAEIPELPKGYLVRETIIEGIKALLLPLSEVSAAASKPRRERRPSTNRLAKMVTVVHGM